MEINRIQAASVALVADTQATGKSSPQAPATPELAPATGAKRNGEPRLEALQNAMRELPDVSFEKVIAIRQALAKGEIDIDSQSLAKLMMTHHRGSER